MAIETVDFELSMRNPETNRYLVAHAYTVDGVTNPDGSLRELSIGQLVMAICLQRAAELESRIIELMDEMSNTSVKLEDLTTIEQKVVDYFPNDNSHVSALSSITVSSGNAQTLLQNEGILNQYQRYVRDDSTTSNDSILYDDFISSIEAKMDDMNSFSQRTMIELQSLTSKRDQSYDMISNILKSLNTVLVGIVNNM